jgi:hypothetical protein
MVDKKGNIFKTFEYLLEKNQLQQAKKLLSTIDKKEKRFLENYNKRKKEGVFYTNHELSRFIIENTLLSYINNKLKLSLKTIYDIYSLNNTIKQQVTDIIQGITLCDPSCGSGNFLLNSVIIIHKLLKRVTQKEKNPHYKLDILRNIYGFDINSRSIRFSKVKLIKWFYTGTSFDNYSKVRSILNSNILEKNSLFNSDLSKLNLKSGGFDIIVGNPPYGNILKKKEKQILKDQKIFFKDVYCAYLLKALEICDGLIGFLIPKSFLLRQSYISFRNKLLSKANLLYIYDLGSSIFKKATNEVQILIYKKKQKSSKNSLKNNSSHLNIYNYPYQKVISYKNQYFDDLKFCLNYECPLINRVKKFYVYTFENKCPVCSSSTTPLNRIRIRCPESLFQLVKKIEKAGDLNYLNIKEYPNFIRGEEAEGLRLVKKALNKNEGGGDCVYIDAKKDFLQPFYFQRVNSFRLKEIDAETLKGNQKEFYKYPKVLIKHNNIYPEALYTEECACFSSSIYSLLKTNKRNLKYLCGLLNSALIHFYCIFGINNQRDTTINLNQYMIRHLPIFSAEKENQMRVADLVDSITQKLQISNGKLNTSLKQNIKSLNNLIFTLYSINNDEKNLIIQKVRKRNSYFNLIYPNNFN